MTATTTILERARRAVATDRARAQLDAQTRKGIEKYGQTLDTYPGVYRDVLQHALEESADLVQYLTRAGDLAPTRGGMNGLARLTVLAALIADEVAHLIDREAP